MDNRQVGFLSLVIGLQSIPNWKKILDEGPFQWWMVIGIIVPVYFITCGILLMASKMTNSKWVVWPIFTYMIIKLILYALTLFGIVIFAIFH